MRSARHPRAWGRPGAALAVALAACGGIGAWEVSTLVTPPLEFNPILTQGLEPLPEAPQLPDTFRGPLGGGRSVVSPLEPALDAVTLTRLKRTPCLWVDSGDELRFNWEMIIPVDPLRPWFQENPFPLGACTLTHHESRVALRGPDGETPDEINLDAVVPSHLLGRRLAPAGAFDECGAFDSGSEVVTTVTAPGSLCTSPPGGDHYPLCALDCRVSPPGGGGPPDGRLFLDFSSGSSRLARLDSEMLVKTVDGSRTLSRRMVLGGAREDFGGCTGSSPPDHTCCNDAGDRCFRWRVDELDPPGGWVENFAPTLFVAAVRFFVPVTTPDGLQRVYVQPTGMYLSVFIEDTDRPLDCVLPPGAPGFDHDSCSVLGLASPVQFNDLLGRRIQWEAVFDQAGLPIVIPRPGMPNDPFVIGDAAGTPAPLRIEFTVIPVQAPAALEARPPGVDDIFNVFDPGADFPYAIELVNVGAQPLDVVDFALEGADAAAFTLAPAGAIPAPLATGASFRLELGWAGTVTAPGALTASVRVAQRPAGSAQVPGQLEVPVSLYADDPGLTPFPEALAFSAHLECGSVDPAHPRATLERVLGFLNASPIQIDVTALALEGPDAGAFAFTESSPTRSVPPGAFYDLAVEYAPATAGVHDATLRASHAWGAGSSLQDRLVPLSGVTTEGCAAPALEAGARMQFGIREVGTSTSGTLQVRNRGGAPLEVQGAGVTGAGAAHYAVQPTQISVAAGGVGSVQVTYAPAQPGVHPAVLSLPSNDPAGTYDVELLGAGAVHELAASRTQVSLSGTTPQPLALHNVGAVPVRIAAPGLSVPAPFALLGAAGGPAALPVEIAPGASAAFQVALAPGTPPGVYAGTLTAETDGTPPGAVSVDLSAAP